MKLLIITYDLVNPAQNLEVLVKKIKTFGSWARLGGSAYLIFTASDVVPVRDKLKEVLSSQDKLFVGTCPVPAAWAGLPEDVAKWILENQPKHS